MTDPWVCIDCGARQAQSGTCQRCANGDTLDVREERVRELMYDVDLRLAQRAESRARMLGVVIGVGTIALLWLVPGYWSLRGTLYPGIPFLVDQWFFMAVIGLGVSKLLEKAFTKKRFPYLDDAQQLRA